MDFITHLVFGALLYSLILGQFTYDYIGLAIFFAVLPDLDIFLGPFRKVFKSNYLEHRGGTHSYIMGILISGIYNIIFSFILPRPFLIAWIVGAVFYGLHVSMDLLTTTAVPYLFPLSRKEKSFYVEKAGSQFTMLLCFILFGIIHLTIRLTGDFNLLSLIINIYTFFFIGYYLYRILSKLIITSRLEPNQKYFPGVLPFYYYILTENQDGKDLLVERKSHFSKKRQIAQSSLDLTDMESSLFQEGSSKIREDYYMAKWTTFPRIEREEGKFIVKFYFLEPMVRSRAMFVQYDFDLSTKQEIDYTQNFGRISAA